MALNRFISDGVLVGVDVSGLLSYKYSVSALKEMLKQRGLQVSGRKDEIIQRLMCADPNGMKQVVAGLSLMQCSKLGKELVEKYLTAEKDDRLKIEQQVMAYLVKREFQEASLLVADYMKKQVFTQGIGIDWKNYNPDKDIEILAAIFKAKPELLSGLDDEKLQNLQLGAAMMQLWGEKEANRWLPDNFETGLAFDENVATRMVLYRAQNSIRVKEYFEAGVVKYIEILACPDSCESCKKLAAKRYKLNEVPDLPNEKCTHELGCRCTTIPVIK